MGLTAIQLSDQAEVRELLRVLEGNGLEKEYQEVKALVSYLDSMEARFGQILNELQDIKGQLSQLQDNNTRGRVVEIVRVPENTVRRTENRFQEAKAIVRRSWQASEQKSMQSALTRKTSAGHLSVRTYNRSNRRPIKESYLKWKIRTAPLRMGILSWNRRPPIPEDGLKISLLRAKKKNLL